MPAAILAASTCACLAATAGLAGWLGAGRMALLGMLLCAPALACAALRMPRNPTIRAAVVAGLVLAQVGILYGLAWQIGLNPPRLLGLILGTAGFLMIVGVAGLFAIGAPPALAALASISTFASLGLGAVGLLVYLGTRPPPATAYEAGGQERDPQLTYRNRPYSIHRQFYPDNPRGYFDEEPEAVVALRRRWRLVERSGAQGRAHFVPGPPPSIRVEVQKATADRPADLHLESAPFRSEPGETIAVRCAARADGPRTIEFSLEAAQGGSGDAAGPAPFKLTKDWSIIEWRTAMRDDAILRCRIDLGRTEGSVELRDVVVEQNGWPVEFLSFDEGDPTAYSITYAVNGLGFRGPDRVVPRPRDVFRIVCLGDSYTFGDGVHEKDTFCHQLERLLEKSPPANKGWRFEVVNGGVPGYATAEERATYERYARTYQPQLVLLVMCWNDDLSLLEEMNLRAAKREEASKKGGMAAIGALLPFDDRPRGDFQRSVQEILKLRESCQSDGARLAVVYFRDVIQRREWDRLTSAVNAGLEGSGIDILDLGPVLARESGGGRLFVHARDQHPNEIAHRLAAEAIAKFLADSGYLPSEPPPRAATSSRSFKKGAIRSAAAAWALADGSGTEGPSSTPSADAP